MSDLAKAIEAKLTVLDLPMEKPAEPEATAAPFPRCRIADIRLSKKVTDPVKGLVAAGDTTALLGKPGTGKSFFALDMAACVARGTPFHGHRTRPGAVLYLHLEGQEGLDKRIQAMRIEGRLSDADPIDFVRVPVELLRDGPRIIATLRDFAASASMPPTVLIVDTLARSLPGLDENTAETMGGVIRASDEVAAATGVSIVLVHHLGKDDTKGARGHSSLNGGIAGEITLTRVGDIRTATVTKSRHGRDGEQLSFKLRDIALGLDDDGDQMTSCVCDQAEPVPRKPRAPTGKLQAKLWSALVEACRVRKVELLPSVEFREIARFQGIDRKRLTEVSDGLTKNGFIQPTTGGWRILWEEQ